MRIKMEYGGEGARYMMKWEADARYLMEGIYAEESGGLVKVSEFVKSASRRRRKKGAG